ncbi:MAG: peptide chain release factor N(5)-glutamine methyltransferase [Oscillospiraceae bacterium]|nr:peptide chain release factor N(5)-glutamine methyltransferase [Oscillospiraceae bacterium]
METYNDVYLRVRKQLKAAGVESPELEARLIISKAAGRSREEILAMNKVYASDKKINETIALFLDNRIGGEPLAYVLGEWEFYGLPIIVNKYVMIPRIDTELLVSEAIKLLNSKVWQTRMLDLCTGSGCIGIAVAANVKDCRIVCADNSEEALAVCRANMLASNLSRNITAIEADALKAPPALLGNFDLIVSNPPYIPSKNIDNVDSSVIDYEPHEALFGGEDGLDFIKSITEKWKKLLKPGGHLALECGIDQAAEVRYIMKKNGFMDIKIYKDTLGIERVLTGRIK